LKDHIPRCHGVKSCWNFAMDEKSARTVITAATGTGRVRRPFLSSDTLRGFPDAQKVRAKTPRPGGGRRSRWKTEDDRIIERDRLHDTVEVYDPTGRRHLAEFDPWDGRQVTPPVTAEPSS
jgi:hypothetical protein